MTSDEILQESSRIVCERVQAIINDPAAGHGQGVERNPLLAFVGTGLNGERVNDALAIEAVMHINQRWPHLSTEEAADIASFAVAVTRNAFIWGFEAGRLSA